MTEEVNLKFDLIFIHLALSSHTRLVATMLDSMGVSVASVDHALRTADVLRRADEWRPHHTPRTCFKYSSDFYFRSFGVIVHQCSKDMNLKMLFPRHR